MSSNKDKTISYNKEVFSIDELNIGSGIFFVFKVSSVLLLSTVLILSYSLLVAYFFISYIALFYVNIFYYDSSIFIVVERI